MKRNQNGLGRACSTLALSTITLAALPTGQSDAAPPEYRVTDLGKFYPSGVNNKGQVSGTVTHPSEFSSIAAYWDRGTTTTVVGHPSTDWAYETWATTINNAGDVLVGAFQYEHYFGSYVWNPSSGSMRPAGGPFSHDINDAGDVANSYGVESVNSDDPYILLANGTMVAIDCPGDLWEGLAKTTQNCFRAPTTPPESMTADTSLAAGLPTVRVGMPQFSSMAHGSTSTP